MHGFAEAVRVNQASYAWTETLVENMEDVLIGR